MNFPIEIQTNVLSYVDNFKQLSRFSLVCKSFHAITTNESFLKSILNNLDINASKLISREKIEKIHETKQNRLTLLWLKMILSHKEYNEVHYQVEIKALLLRNESKDFVKLASSCLHYDGILHSLESTLLVTPMETKEILDSLRIDPSMNSMLKTKKDRKASLLGLQAMNDYFNLQKFYPDMLGHCVKNLFKDKNIQNIVCCSRSNSKFHFFSNTVFSALCSHLAESSHPLGKIYLTINNSQLPKILSTLKEKIVDQLFLEIPDLTTEGIDLFDSLSEIKAIEIKIKFNSIFYKNENKKKELEAKSLQLTLKLIANHGIDSWCMGTDDTDDLKQNWKYDGIYWASIKLLPVAIKTIFESNANESSKE